MYRRLARLLSRAGYYEEEKYNHLHRPAPCLVTIVTELPRHFLSVISTEYLGVLVITALRFLDVGCPQLEL
jgi:hypothetical protein